MNAPIRYFGGKGGMFRDIIAHFPPPDYDTYIEPFGGAYSVGLQMPYLPPIEIYNDLERNVYTLYKVIRDDALFPAFVRRVNLTPYHEDERNEARATLDREGITDLERAVAFFVANRLSHNGIGGFSCTGIVRRGMDKCVSDYLTAMDGLGDLHVRLRRLVVYNRDALDLIAAYATPNCFLYCDPPYLWDKRGSYRYKVDHDNGWHGRFVTACLASKARILVSGYDGEEYARLEAGGFRKVTFDVNMTDGTHKPVTRQECLWMNYDDSVRPDGQMNLAFT